MQLAAWATVAGILFGIGFGQAAAREAPTLGDLEEELRQSDLVIRGSVVKLWWEGFLGHAFSQDVTVRIEKRYKGRFPGAEIRLFLNLPTVVHPVTGPRPAVAADVGDQLIVPVKAMRVVTALQTAGRADRPAFYYTAPSFYRVQAGEVVGSPYRLSEELARHRQLADFERLIEKLVAQPPKQFDRYVPGRVLFFDDFDDGSFAGWTFLVGARDGEARIDDFYGEKWVGPGLRWTNKYPEAERGTRGKLTRNPQTGNYEGVIDGARIEIGVYDGRLRLRSSRLWHHVTAVAGDPSWENYQVECDVWKFKDKALGEPEFPERIAQEDYMEFGIYGRVRVPNLPQTAGEHSLIAVEFGAYSNEITLVPMWTRVPHSLWHNYFQIRAKWPDPDAPREASFWTRKTRILDYTTYPIPTGKRMHLTARFMGERVEGYIDGVKYVDGYLSPLPDIMRRGRMGLWVFETWAEFDNVRVTELVRKNR